MYIRTIVASLCGYSFGEWYGEWKGCDSEAIEIVVKISQLNYLNTSLEVSTTYKTIRCRLLRGSGSLK